MTNPVIAPAPAHSAAAQEAGGQATQAMQPNRRQTRTNCTDLHDMRISAQISIRKVNLSLARTDANARFLFQGERRSAGDILHVLQQEVDKPRYKRFHDYLYELTTESRSVDREEVHKQVTDLIAVAIGMERPSEQSYSTSPLIYLAYIVIGGVAGGLAGALINHFTSIGTLVPLVMGAIGLFAGGMAAIERSSTPPKSKLPTIELPDYPNLNRRGQPTSDTMLDWVHHNSAMQIIDTLQERAQGNYFLKAL